MLFALAVAAGLGILLVLYFVPKWQTKNLISERRANLENEFRKTLAQIIGGVAVILGLYFGWQQLQAASKSLEVTREGQITDRYTRAVEQLGSKKLTVRLGGIYALGEISKDPDRDHYWSVIEVLAGFLRDSTAWRNTALPSNISVDVQAALSVIASRDPRHTREAREELVDLDGTDLRRAFLKDASLAGARLSYAHLDYADCRAANLEKADLAGAHLGNTLLRGAYMDSANLLGADLTQAVLSGAHLRSANLRGAVLSGADLRRAEAEGANFEEVRM